MWNLLQLSDCLDLELSSALAESVPLTAWKPLRTLSPFKAHTRATPAHHPTPNLRICTFPILRGYARPLISRLVPTHRILLQRLLRETPHPADSPLILTAPYFAELAEQWPGPVIYWLTDLIAAYQGVDRNQVIALDRRLCRAATLVCPNSQRLADYLVEQANCDPARLVLLPNAVRDANLLAEPPTGPAPLPAALAHLPRPLAGVIGNMAANHDWLMLGQIVEHTPAFQWAFVGDTSMPIDDRPQARARAALMQHPRCTFIGHRPYAELVQFSRAFDVAVLPYARHEPTRSGSSTRFYEHLAACRPMLAFPGVEELLSKTPLLTLAGSVDEALNTLEDLRLRHFDDELASLRWRTARAHTWSKRARTLQHALATRLAQQPTNAALASVVS